MHLSSTLRSLQIDNRFISAVRQMAHLNSHYAADSTYGFRTDILRS